jgi:hypothetical protein
MSELLKEGNTVTIRVQNILWDKRHLYAQGVVTQEFNVYSGTVIRHKWFAEDEIGLTTSNPEFPFRRIRKARIVEVNDLPVSYAEPKASERIERIVQGSKGNTYTVVKEGGKITCTCPGFTFRSNCKHTLEIA